MAAFTYSVALTCILVAPVSAPVVIAHAEPVIPPMGIFGTLEALLVGGTKTSEGVVTVAVAWANVV